MGVEKKDLVDPLDLHPMRAAPAPEVTGEEAWGMLDAVFGG